MSTNLLEKARANRLIALEVLKQRENNLVILNAARKHAKRRQQHLFFSSCRSVAPSTAMQRAA